MNDMLEVWGVGNLAGRTGDEEMEISALIWS